MGVSSRYRISLGVSFQPSAHLSYVQFDPHVMIDTIINLFADWETEAVHSICPNHMYIY